MKCIMCNGKLEEKIVEHKEFGVSLGRFKAKVCNKCGEIFFNSKTAVNIQAKSKQLGLFGLTKKTRVAEVGNSLAIRIPRDVANFMKMKKEDEIKIVPKGRNELSIILTWDFLIILWGNF